MQGWKPETSNLFGARNGKRQIEANDGSDDDDDDDDDNNNSNCSYVNSFFTHFVVFLVKFASSFEPFCLINTHVQAKSHQGHPRRPPKHPRESIRDPPEHAKAPQETPQDTPGDPQEAPKAPQGSLLSLILASFWPHFGSLGESLDGCLIFRVFLMLFGSLFEPILAPFSIQRLIIFVIQFCMCFYCVFDSLFLQIHIHF